MKHFPSQNHTASSASTPKRGFGETRLRFDSRGFSLLEVMIALGITGFAMLVSASLLVRSDQDNVASADRNEAEMSSLFAEMYLRSFLGQAVDLSFAGNTSLDGYAGVHGVIRQYDSSDSALPSTANTIAVFQRELGGQVDLPPRQSVFNASGIYFMKPTASTSGVLFFDPGLTTPNVVGPSYSVPFVGDLVEFSVAPNNSLGVPSAQTITGPAATGSVLTSVDIRYVVRYFEPGAGPKVWCPNPAPAYTAFASSTCAALQHRNFHDVIKFLTVVIRNNQFAPSLQGGTGPDRPLGKLYFFPIFHTQAGGL